MQQLIEKQVGNDLTRWSVWGASNITKLDTYQPAPVRERVLFMEHFCNSSVTRLNLPKMFDVEIDSYEDLAPGQWLYGWLCKGRQLHDTVMTFKVIDKRNGFYYYPVFPREVAKTLLRAWKWPVPPRWSIYADYAEYRKRYCPPAEKKNQQLRNLLAFARLFVTMQHYHHSYTAMPYGFREIFNYLYTFPESSVDVSVVRLINKVLGECLREEGAFLNCDNLQIFISYLRNRYSKLNFIESDFAELRELLWLDNAEAKCYF